MTFVASTGDYGTADPEYPAFSPNVVAVGGTSLDSQRRQLVQQRNGLGLLLQLAWARSSASGGGISLYEAGAGLPAGRAVHGLPRRTPDVSFVADPATGAWIADPYNLPADNPLEVVGGTSLSAPCLGRPARPGQPGPGGRRRSDPQQHQPDRGPAGPLQPAAERFQRASPAAATAATPRPRATTW